MITAIDATLAALFFIIAIWLVATPDLDEDHPTIIAITLLPLATAILLTYHANHPG